MEHTSSHGTRKETQIIGVVIAALLGLSLLWRMFIVSPGDLQAATAPIQGLEARVERLEHAMQNQRESLARIETKLDVMNESLRTGRIFSPRSNTN